MGGTFFMAFGLNIQGAFYLQMAYSWIYMGTLKKSITIYILVNNGLFLSIYGYI